MSKRTPVILIFMSVVLLVLDRILKLQALSSLGGTISDHPIGWEPFLNDGIAFGIVLPRAFVVLVTMFILSAVLYLVYYHVKLSPKNARASVFYGLALVMVGAISNLADRVYYGSAVDYIRIFLSVINLADVYIIVGFIVYFWSLKEIK